MPGPFPGGGSGPRRPARGLIKDHSNIVGLEEPSTTLPECPVSEDPIRDPRPREEARCRAGRQSIPDRCPVRFGEKSFFFAPAEGAGARGVRHAGTGDGGERRRIGAVEVRARRLRWRTPAHRRVAVRGPRPEACHGWGNRGSQAAASPLCRVGVRSGAGWAAGPL